VTTYVIVQISSSIVGDLHLAPYLEYLVNSVIPKYEAAVGMVSVYLLQRRFVAYVEISVVSLWRSQEGLQAFAQSEPQFDIVKRMCGVIEAEPHTFVLVLLREGKAFADEKSEP
jgi:hypothetical protein